MQRRRSRRGTIGDQEIPRESAPRAAARSTASQPARPATAELSRALARPQRASPAALLQLQRAAGNRAVGRLLAGEAASPPASPEGLSPVPGAANSPAAAAKLTTGPAPGRLSTLPPPLANAMGSALEDDFSTVRIHVGSPSATRVGALAYSRGEDVHFAPGQYQPHTQAGRELLGHELAHVVQQRQGRVVPTTRIQGLRANEDPALEAEAAIMGRAAARTVPRSAEPARGVGKKRVGISGGEGRQPAGPSPTAIQCARVPDRRPGKEPDATLELDKVKKIETLQNVLDSYSRSSERTHYRLPIEARIEAIKKENEGRERLMRWATGALPEPTRKGSKQGATGSSAGHASSALSHSTGGSSHHAGEATAASSSSGHGPSSGYTVRWGRLEKLAIVVATYVTTKGEYVTLPKALHGKKPTGDRIATLEIPSGEKLDQLVSEHVKSSNAPPSIQGDGSPLLSGSSEIKKMRASRSHFTIFGENPGQSNLLIVARVPKEKLYTKPVGDSLVPDQPFTGGGLEVRQVERMEVRTPDGRWIYEGPDKVKALLDDLVRIFGQHERVSQVYGEDASGDETAAASSSSHQGAALPPVPLAGHPGGTSSSSTQGPQASWHLPPLGGR